MRSQAKAASAGSIEGSRRFRALLLVLFASLALSSLLAASAQAADVYRFLGDRFATKGSGPGEVKDIATQVAVDDQSGYLLFTTRSEGVNVFAPSGAETVFSNSFGAGEIAGAEAVAIDQDARSVYVGDLFGGQILKYDISGSGPLTFTRDLTFTSPSLGSGPGQIPGLSYARFAVDPTTGDLLVGGWFIPTINRYSSDGTFISSFDGTGSPGGAFHRVSDVAVDASGSIYVVDMTVEDILREGSVSVLERFAPDGTPDTSFLPDIPTPRSVTTDPSTGNVVVVGRSDGGVRHERAPVGPYPVRLYMLHDDQVVDELDFPVVDSGAWVSSLAIGAGASKRLYAATTFGYNGDQNSFGGRNGAYALESFKAPDLTFNEPSAVTTSTVQVSGTVNPVGQASSYHFEYSREGGPTERTPDVVVNEGGPPGEVPVAVSGELTGLLPNSEYEVRLVGVATGTGVSIRSSARHFKTAAAAPFVIVGDAIDRTSTTVTLLGKVNPLGQQTSYRFEYGTSTTYGQQQPVDHDDVIGTGRDHLAVHAYLTKLLPGTEYHYRVVATNATGTTFGPDRTFMTLGPADRVYEQVTPVEKGGSEANGLRIFYATPDGEGLLYQWKTSPSDALAGPTQPRGFGWREPAGWSALALEPQQMEGSGAFSNTALSFVFGLSEDGTKVVGISFKALAPGSTEGNTNLYLRDTRTGAYTTIASIPGKTAFADMVALQAGPVIDGTSDYSRILFRPRLATLIPGAPEQALYEWSQEDGLRVASIAPDGSAISYIYAGTGIATQVHEPHYISADGSKVFFQAMGGGTYVRYDGEETVFIGGRFGGATRDGHYAFVFGSDLTPDSEPGIQSLYRFDTETRQLELLTATGEFENLLQVSPNGASVFWNSSAVITPDAVENHGNVYVWHGGEVQLIADRDPSLDGGAGQPPPEYMSSRSGRYFAFVSFSPLTGYDTRSTACREFNEGDTKDPTTGEGLACRQVYRYDVEAEELLCASCPRDGSVATGRARITSNNVEGDFSFNRAMLDDGTVIFDTTNPLNSRDVNSNRDVYTFNGRETALISAGENNVSSQFDAASADGRDIFFTTQDQLVGQDTDTQADVYDARIGGGIPGQNPPPKRGECIRDDCKAIPNGGPELPFGGSEGLNGPENVSEAARKRCGKGRKARTVKGKARCVKQKQAKKHRRQANSNRRQGR